MFNIQPWVNSASVSDCALHQCTNYSERWPRETMTMKKVYVMGLCRVDNTDWGLQDNQAQISSKRLTSTTMPRSLT